MQNEKLCFQKQSNMTRISIKCSLSQGPGMPATGQVHCVRLQKNMDSKYFGEKNICETSLNILKNTECYS